MSKTDRSVTHATFSIARNHPVAASRVFEAYRDPEIRDQWLDDPDFKVAPGYADYKVFDFRIGGSDRFAPAGPAGRVYRYGALFYDIVPDQRIIYRYEMYQNEERLSVSVATVQLTAEADGTRLMYAEPGAYLDEFDEPEYRQEGMAGGLDSLQRWFRSHP